ncbi:hypothetical protein EV360DRAFT_25463, partial [Lentinula raphanica]
VKEFELYLKHGSPADAWYAEKAPTLGDWDAFIVAFRIQFPAPKVQARTPMEYERILVELRLDEDKMLERHQETHNYMWRWFADELLRYAKLAKVDSGCSSIIAVRDALPYALKCKVGDEHGSWTSFVEAIKTVQKQDIEEGMERKKFLERARERTVTEAVMASKKFWDSAPQIPESPSKALGRSFSGMGLESGHRAGFGGGQRGGFGSRGGHAGGRGPFHLWPFHLATLSEDQPVATLARNANLLPHHPDTVKGQRAYREQLASWARQWGREAVIDFQKPVPLTPGTAPICSGECYNCGMRGHQGRSCTATGAQALGPREREWRVLCGRHLPRALPMADRPRAVNSVMDAEFGKWGRINGINGTHAIPECIRINTKTSGTFLADNELVVDLFLVGTDGSRLSTPKVVEIELEDALGMKLSVEALVDGGAMVAAMDKSCYERVKDKIRGWENSTKRLRMANGVVVSAVAQWRGKVKLQGVMVEGVLQVFDSGGTRSWEVLLGKPLLHTLGAVHDFRDDSLRV